MCPEYCGGHHPGLHGWDCLCQAVKTKEQDEDCGVFQVSTFPAKTRHGLVWQECSCHAEEWTAVSALQSGECEEFSPAGGSCQGPAHTEGGHGGGGEHLLPSAGVESEFLFTEQNDDNHSLRGQVGTQMDGGEDRTLLLWPVTVGHL